MQPEYARHLLEQLSTLADVEASRHGDAQRQVGLLEAQLAEAKARMTSTAMRAGLSRQAADAAQRLVPSQPEPAETVSEEAERNGEGPSAGAGRMTVGEQVLTFLRARGEADVPQILQHMRTLRPGINKGGISPVLTKLCKKGLVNRISTGRYRPVPVPEE
ncbi:tyrosine-protein phosphatase [Streptomyces sp. STCH 565 A]|uniref:tyrosine-protein phosphatase n=1 Tax=Streptomyces sp. STCH 565 A TaxID=2950532 RepID=UPI00207554FC|nr:tyrosine-protein phosphatase [Streptomyces sp. STCH 565 A]MCM8555478.1 tyrosine-protein phosphatase [Streptomyces sp. STCH 565 A]